MLLSRPPSLREKQPNRKLAAARQAAGWTQKELADHLGTTDLSVSRWERGEHAPGPYYRYRLCTLFGKSEHELGLLSGDTQVCQTTLFDPAVPLPLTGTRMMVGRETLVNHLKDCLLLPRHGVLTALSGLPGVGKTALAVALAHDPDIHAGFPDGILWAGLGPQATVMSIFARWAGQLAIPPVEKAHITSADQWALALRSAIGMRRILLVIDDAWSIEDALACKVGGPHTAYLLTTRFTPIALHFAGDGIQVVPELGVEDGLALLSQLVPMLATTEPEEARRLVQAVGGLPLALVLLGNYLRVQMHSGQPRRITAALTQLADAMVRLKVVQPQGGLEQHSTVRESASLSLWAVIGTSVQRLETEQTSALAGLSVFPARPNSFSEEAALAVTVADPGVLDVLCDAGLLQSSGPGRYSLHQVIADYARSHLLSDTAVFRRFAGYVAGYIAAHAKEYEALEPESDNIVAALEIAFAQNLPELLIQMALALSDFLDTRGMYALAERHLRRACDAAAVLGKDDDRLKLLYYLGKVTYRQGSYTRAEQAYLEGLDLARRLNTIAQIAQVLSGLGELAIDRGEYIQAEAYLQEGMALARQRGDGEQISGLLRNLGWICQNRGDLGQAEVYYQEGLELARKLGHHELTIRLLTGLGTVESQRGDAPSSQKHYQEGLELARRLGLRKRISVLLMNLGTIAEERGEYAVAEAYSREALAIAHQLGLRERTGGVLGNLGVVAAKQGNLKQASAYFQEALEIVRALGHRELICFMLTNLGLLALDQEEDTTAEAYLREGLDLARSIGSQERVPELLSGLGASAMAHNDLAHAEAYFQEALAVARQIEFPWQVCDTLCGFGEFLLQQSRLEAASSVFHEVLDYAHLEFHDLLAQAQYGLARVAEALGDSARACELGEASLRTFEAMGHKDAKRVRDWLEAL